MNAFDRTKINKSWVWLWVLSFILSFDPLYAFCSWASSQSPHLYSKDLKASNCQKCHLNKPVSLGKEEEEIKNNLKSEYSDGCKECHTEKIPLSCQLSLSNKISTILTDQIKPFPLPLFRGQMSCLTCHKVHQPSEPKAKTFILRLGFKDFQKSAENLPPHRAGIACFLCHEKEPGPQDKNLSLKYNGDIVVLCKSCHNNLRARADNHPVNILPSKDGRVTIPENFPLSDGKVTCITCHKLSCVDKNEAPFFLRGGPYQRRIDTCLVCHVREQLVKINPHDQLTDTGEIAEDRCLFCHDINKESGKGLTFKFKASLKFYCLGCHPIDIEKHPFGAHHTGRQIHTLWGNLKHQERIELSQQEKFKMFPLTLDGKIMCTTCHNPHDVRKGPKLRINDVNKSCRQCHYKKYGPIIKTDKEAGRQWLPKREQAVLPSQSVPLEEDLGPGREDKVPFGYRASLNYYCIGCHANKETNHPYGVAHTGRFINKFWESKFKSKNSTLADMIEGQILPLTLSGQIGCFTCHNPHNSAKGPKLRVESREQLCVLCHPDQSKIMKEYLENNLPKGE